MDQSRKSKKSRAPQKGGMSSKSSAPVATSRKVKTSRPSVTSGKNGDVRVCHREYVQDINGSGVFSVNSFSINPGLKGLFPWLSQIASRYESYRFNSLQFHLNTLAPTSSVGSVILAVDYDAADVAPVSKVQSMSYASSVRGAPWQDLDWSGAVDDLHKAKSNYVRMSVSLPAGLDIKTYDVGNLHVIRQGQANTNAISELYVSYDITLMTPQLETGDLGSLAISAADDLDGTHLFGTAPVLDPDSSVAVRFDASGAILTFDTDFTGLWTCKVMGDTIATLAAAGSTCTVTSIFNSAPLVGAGQYCCQFRVTALRGQALNLQLTATDITGITHLAATLSPSVA